MGTTKKKGEPIFAKDPNSKFWPVRDYAPPQDAEPSWNEIEEMTRNLLTDLEEDDLEEEGDLEETEA